MEVNTDRLIEILEKIHNRLRKFDERVALGCAIESVKELGRIQKEEEKNEL